MIDIAPDSNHYLTYDQAFLYCLTLTHNNHKDWRLPTRNEYRVDDRIYPGVWYQHRSGTGLSSIHITQAVREPNDN